MTSRPHILIFNPDQWRADTLGHLGHPAGATPSFDALVEKDGVSFAWAFAQATVCTPSRCSFTTGLYPHVHGHRSLHHMLHRERGQQHMFNVLRDNDYFVWWGGKNDLVPGDDPPENHCDVYFRPDAEFFARHGGTPQPDLHGTAEQWRGEPGSDGYYSFLAGALETPEGAPCHLDRDWQMVLGAIDLIRNPPEGRPLCIYLPLLYPHPPYGVEREFFDSMASAPLLARRKLTEALMAKKPRMLRRLAEAQGLSGWDEERWDLLRRTYLGMVARVDRQFAMLTEALRETGLYEQTAIFAFSDHGDYTGDFDVVEKTQVTFDDPLTRVPLVVKPPVGVAITPGVRRDTMAELTDVTATIWQMTGIDPGFDSFGRSLLSSIADPAVAHRDVVFCEGGRRPDEVQVSEANSLSGFGDAPWRSLYWPKIDIQIHDPAAHGRAVMARSLTGKYVRRMSDADEYYDLASDPLEYDNRIADPTCAAPIEALKDRLLDWYLATSDVVPREPDLRPLPPPPPTLPD
jgi:arylsulfatase A-like enzyme